MRPFNPSVIDEVRVARLTATAADRPLVKIVGSHGTSTALADTAISGTDRSGATSDPDWQTITVDADGTGTSASPEALITLKYGPSNSAGDGLDTTTYGATAWKFSHSAAGSNETAVTSLKALVDAINAISIANNDGRVFKAYIGDELTTYTLDHENLTDVAETRLPVRDWVSGVLPGAIADVDRVAKRIGVPEPRYNGRVKLIGISGTCTGATNGTVKLYRDDIDEGSPELLQEWALAEANTDYVNYDTDGAPVYRGSLVLVVESDDLSALDLTVRYQNVEY